MSGIAELKAGPTHEQQQRARDLRVRLLNDLQEQVIQHKQATAEQIQASFCHGWHAHSSVCSQV